MSTTVGQEDWEALMEVLQEAIQMLSGNQSEPVKLKILEFSSTAAMLELQDLADCAGRFETFLLSTVAPDWDDEATATLSFSMGALVEKMQMSSYGPAFSAGLSEVLMYLDFYGEEEGAPEPELPVAPAEEAMKLAVEESPAVIAVREEPVAAPVPPIAEPSAVDEDALLAEILAGVEHPVEEIQAEEQPAATPTAAAPPVAAPPVVDEDALLAEIVAGVEQPVEELQAEGQPSATPIAAVPLVSPVVSITSESLPSPRPRPVISEFDSDADGYVIDRYDWYREVLREDPRSRLFIGLGEELCDSGLWDEAIEVCRQGLFYHPDSMRARVLLGRALWESGHKAEARVELIQVHRGIADNAVLYHLLASIAETDGESQLVDGFRQTGRFLDEESRRLAFDRVASAPVPTPSPVAKVPVPEVPVEEPVKVLAPSAREKDSPEMEVLGWLMRLQGLFAEKETVSPVIAPLFRDEDRELIKAMLSGPVS